MLKNIPTLLSPELLKTLAEMGHGDNLVLVDRNFPAHSVACQTTSKKMHFIPVDDLTEAANAIFSLMPLDTFVDKPVFYMDPVDQPGQLLDVHTALIDCAQKHEKREIKAQPVERMDFYEQAKKAYAVVQTNENRPYGCFILKKGVIFD